MTTRKQMRRVLVSKLRWARRMRRGPDGHVYYLTVRDAEKRLADYDRANGVRHGSGGG